MSYLCNWWCSSCTGQMLKEMQLWWMWTSMWGPWARWTRARACSPWTSTSGSTGPTPGSSSTTPRWRSWSSTGSFWPGSGDLTPILSMVRNHIYIKWLCQTDLSGIKSIKTKHFFIFHLKNFPQWSSFLFTKTNSHCKMQDESQEVSSWLSNLSSSGVKFWPQWRGVGLQVWNVVIININIYAAQIFSIASNISSIVMSSLLSILSTIAERGSLFSSLNAS